MNIESEYQSEDNNNSVTIMDIAMNFMFDKFIAEREESLSEEEAVMLAEVGLALKIVAQKARAFELIQEGKNPNSRN
ncbi:MAG: hypothetical protein EBY39_02845 [Flavobacteriia bacterium]|nr:hypothetical protein [Flavobacteriia bacterium]